MAMFIDRRSFLASLSAATLVPPSCTFGGVSGVAEPTLRLGVLSDIHVTVPECCRQDEHAKGALASLGAFKAALRLFRERGVDVVVIAGDLTCFGQMGELRAIASAWREVFPDDKGADGAKVEKVFILGNHDSYGWRWMSGWTGQEWKGEDRRRKWAQSIAHDPAAAWKECFGEEFAPIQTKTVKGVEFVYAHWPVLPENDRNWRQGADVPGLGEWFAANGDAFSGGKPFFYVQHAHPKGTCFFSSVAADSGISTNVLSRFPNAIAISGHAHQPLTDDRNVWQGAFTSIGAASLLDAGGRSWRENGAPYGKGRSVLAKMPYLKTPDCKHGQYMRLYANRLEIDRLDFMWGLPLGPSWTVPLPADGHERFGGIGAEHPAPLFAAGKSAEVVQDGDLVKVRFPASTEGGRAYDYEVRAVLMADDHEMTALSRRILAPDYHLPPAKIGRPGEVWFARAELPPKSRIRFEVRAINCLGRAGNALTTVFDGI